jgi:protein O-mannosyl-transferase
MLKRHLDWLWARAKWPRPSLVQGEPSALPNWVLISTLILCAVLPYLNTLSNEFVYDDSVQVLENPYIQNFRYLPQIFTTTAWSFTGQGPSNYYRPMMSLGYLFCYQIFGRSAWGFHLVNILLHVAVVGIVFLLAVRLFRSRPLAFWAAALFALHPVHTESVAWIGAVTDLEVTFFYLLTFFFFLQTAKPEGTTDRRMQIAMVLSFVLAAISKEQALTLPLLAAIYEHFFRHDRTETTWSQKVSRYDLLWIAAAAYMVVRIRLLGAFAPSSQFPDLSRTQILLSSIALLGHYFWKLLFPAQLCAFYVFHKSVGPWDWRVLAGGAAGMIYTALLIVLWRRARDMAFALMWLLLTLVPVLNASFVGENVFAERYLYLPSVGFCWLLAWAGLRLWEGTGNRPILRKAFAAGLSVAAVLCGVRIVTRNSDWHDNLTFFQRTLASSPDAYIIRVDLGAAYDRIGDAEDAERQWNEVLKGQPDNKVALADLGMLYSRQGLQAMARQYLQQAIKADPSYAEAHTKLGFVYLQSGELDKAASEFHSSIRVAPVDISGYAGLAYVYWKSGKITDAEQQLHRAGAINPADPRVYFAMAQIYAGTGRLEEARQQYEKALRLDPDNAEAQAGLQELDSKLRR